MCHNTENRTSTELHNRKGRTAGWEGDNSSVISGLVLLTECTLVQQALGAHLLRQCPLEGTSLCTPNIPANKSG